MTAQHTVYVGPAWEAPLLAIDRCDGCGSQAYHRATLPSGGELLFCAHHGREAIPVLKERVPAVLVYSDVEGLKKIANKDDHR